MFTKEYFTPYEINISKINREINNEIISQFPNRQI